MNTSNLSINPFYAARQQPVLHPHEPTTRPSRSTPACHRHRKPASPVPHLTSLYHFHRAGEYGDRKWPGNCGGNLIKDLLIYFKPTGAGVATPWPAPAPAATCARNSASRAWHGTFIRVSTPATRRNSRKRRRSISSGHTRPTGGMKLYADRSAATCHVSPTLEHFLRALRPVHQELRRCPQTRGQAGHPYGRLFRPRGRIRPARLPHKTPGFRRRAHPTLHRHHPFLARRQQRQESLPIVLHPRPARRLHDLREDQRLNH